jgi:hypothetical protein
MKYLIQAFVGCQLKSLRDSSMDKPMPPLVANLRKKAKEFRDNDCAGATDASRSLLRRWFQEKHLVSGQGGFLEEFRNFFCATRGFGNPYLPKQRRKGRK